MQKFLLGAIVGGLTGLALGAMVAAGSLVAVKGLAAFAGRVVALCGGVAGFVGMYIGGVSGAAAAAGGGPVRWCVAAVALAFAAAALAARHVGQMSAGGWQVVYAAGAALAAAGVLVWYGWQRTRSDENAAAAGPRGWRRFAQFPLSTLLALFVMVGALLSALVSGPVVQARAVAALRRNGARVFFPYTTDAPPSWLSFLLGETSGKTDSVETVILNGPTIDDTQLAWLGNLPDVREVRITNAAVTDAGLVHLRKLKRLKALSVEGVAITDAGLKTLSSLHQLESLALRRTRITDAGLAHLTGLTGLQGLSLSGTKITDAGLSDVGKLSKLEFLDLGRTSITDAGLKHLLDLSALRDLRVEGTGVTPAGAEVLADLPLSFVQITGPRG